MDLGECPKIHDLALRADYEWATKNKDYYYDIDVSTVCIVVCREHHWLHFFASQLLSSVGSMILHCPIHNELLSPFQLTNRNTPKRPILNMTLIKYCGFHEE